MSCSRFQLALLASVIAGCGNDGSIQGARDPCATASGSLLGCWDEPIDTPEDACWRLVECGAIPLDYEEDPNIFDWAQCVETIERLSGSRYDFALTCIETSSCDDLKLSHSPVDPARWDRALPLCLQFGDPP